MNLFKKTTATVALVALVSSILGMGAASANSAQTDAANALAAAGYINDHSDNAAAYNLNQNVLRQEIAAVARGISGEAKKTSCDNSFTDVSATTPNTWACASIEALLDADLIASNTMFKPENEISKAEAVGMMVKAAFGDEYSFDASKATGWQEQVVDFAVSKGVVSSFTNFDTAATRGFVFEAGNNADVASSEVVEACDEVSQLLGLCDEETTEETTEENNDDDVVVIVGDNVLSAELSADTAAGTDLPKLAAGVEVLTFDITAGSEDVSVTGVELERSGFGEAAADEAVIYTEEGRASKVKSFSNSDDMVNLTFSPAVVVKAGETRALTVKVNTSSTEGEFTVSVNNITASSTVSAATIVSNYFEVQNATAAVIEIDAQGVNTNIKAGEEQADIAEFKLTNNGNGGTADIDVTVSSITFKELGSVDQEDALENLTLTVNGDVVSTVAMMEGKYVTFNFDPIVIEEDKNETFAVKADIMAGAGETVQLEIDDVADITATASKYNAVSFLATDLDDNIINIDAGELTLYAIDAESDEIRQDKTNVVLGQIKIVNVAGKNLELNTLGVVLTASFSGVLEVLENDTIEFEVNGTSYDLDTSATDTDPTATFKDTDLGIVIPQGTTILTIRADTLDNLTDGQTITMSLDSGSTTTFLVEDTEEDVTVDDITPSALSFDAVEIVNSAATISNVTLGDIEVVKGATDLVALQFEIEAGKASYVTADKIKVRLWNNSGSVAITKTEVSEIALYQGSVSESNLLDKVSGSKLAAGYATFDGFEVEVAADATETFIVTVSTVDTDDVVGAKIYASIATPSTDVELEDDENDTITLSDANTIADKIITVLNTGTLTLTADSSFDLNEDDKVILAGTDNFIFSAKVKASNEEVNAEIVAFTLTGTLSSTGSFRNVITSAKLFLGNTEVANASNSDVVSADVNAGAVATAVITFDNISDLVFGTSDDELRLSISTQTIGESTTSVDRDGIAVSGLVVTKVEIDDAKGDNSGDDVTVTDLTTTLSKDTAIVPVKITPSVTNTVNGTDGSAEITMTVVDGNNTDDNGSELDTILKTLHFNVLTIDGGTGTLLVENVSAGTSASVTLTAVGTQDVTIAGDINNGDIVKVTISSGSETFSVNLELLESGVTYTTDSVDYTSIVSNKDSIGTYSK